MRKEKNRRKLKKEIDEVESNRNAGEKTYSVEELEESLKAVVNQ